ncbi:phosphotransferase enzyme family protein [Virgibacillus kimchii]
MTEYIKAKHTLIDEVSITELLQHYELEIPIEQCRFLTSGLNDTYFIKDKNNAYIFRVYRNNRRNESAILFELDALNHLKENHFPVSYPINKKDGTYLCEILAPEGVRYGVLFSYTKGERPKVNAENALLMGRALGKMHELMDSFHTKYSREFQIDADYLLDQPVSFITPVLQTYFDKSVVNSFHETIENMKTELMKRELEIGFCHGDFHNRNMHIHQDKLELFDFDDCAVGYRAYDIAVSWWNLITNYKNDEKECWDAFMEGYLTQRKLQKDDYNVLPYLTTARRIRVLGNMLENDDVWGRNWINKQALELFVLQVKTDHITGN